MLASETCKPGRRAIDLSFRNFFVLFLSCNAILSTSAFGEPAHSSPPFMVANADDAPHLQGRMLSFFGSDVQYTHVLEKPPQEGCAPNSPFLRSYVHPCCVAWNISLYLSPYMHRPYCLFMKGGASNAPRLQTIFMLRPSLSPTDSHSLGSSLEYWPSARTSPSKCRSRGASDSRSLGSPMTACLSLATDTSPSESRRRARTHPSKPIFPFLGSLLSQQNYTLNRGRLASSN